MASRKLRCLLLFLGICYVVDAKIGKSKHRSVQNLVKDEDQDEHSVRYKPNWDDLDTRPIPEWFDKAKIGIFLHWGVYCVPGFYSEWFWKNWKDHNWKVQLFMAENYPPEFTYQEFAPLFKAEFFDPVKWANLFQKSGAKYIVLTSKHHEGFTMFPSTRSFSWNSVDVGPRQDIVGTLAHAVRKNGMKFGVYHSLYEWYNPIYEGDRDNSFRTRVYPDTKLWPDLKQLIEDYKPSVLWADGDWEAKDTYWNSTGFLAWLYNDSPVKNEIVVNDRWGMGTAGKHGDFYNHADRYNPGVLQQHKWENAFTVDSKSWGYRRNLDLSDVLTTSQILYEVVSTVSCGGNVLINVGPTKEGTIPVIFQERLLTLGEWLSINGEAIYATSPWTAQNDTLNSDVWYTCTKTKYNALSPTKLPRSDDTITAVYAIILKWPENNSLKVKALTQMLHSGNYKIQMLENGGTDLVWKINNGESEIELPDKSTVKSRHAWALKVIPK